jgi:hypothetical protein
MPIQVYGTEGLLGTGNPFKTRMVQIPLIGADDLREKEIFLHKNSVLSSNQISFRSEETWGDGIPQAGEGLPNRCCRKY